MPLLQQPRIGERLEVKNRPLPFSKWPSRKGRLHYGLQSLIFARDPWLVIAKSINEQCPRPRKLEALACLEQAKDFYVAAVDGSILAARPLVLYYSFMNLAKAYSLTRGTEPTFDQAQHGLKERRSAGAQELLGAYLKAHPSPFNGQLENFAEFKEALTGAGLSAVTDYQLTVLLPQDCSWSPFLGAGGRSDRTLHRSPRSPLSARTRWATDVAGPLLCGGRLVPSQRVTAALAFGDTARRTFSQRGLR